MNAALASLPRTAPLEEYTGDPQAFDFAAVVARSKPLVIRGLVSDWPIVKLAKQSDTAFAQRLAELDNGADVTTLMIAPEADGIIKYTPDLADFNYQHFKVPVKLGLERLAKYSQSKRAPGLVIQSVPIRECLPRLLADHALPFLDSGIEPRLWMGNRTITPTHFDSQQNIACVVCGTRRSTLFPPEQLPNLYVGPLDWAPTGAAISLARLDQTGRSALPTSEAGAGRGAGSRVARRRCHLHPAVVVAPRRIAGTTQRAGELLVESGRCVGIPHRPCARRPVPLPAGLSCIAARRARRGVLGPLTAENVEKLREYARRNL